MFNSLWGFLSIAVICSMVPVAIAALRGKPTKGGSAPLQQTVDDLEDFQVELEKKLDDSLAAIQKLEARIANIERRVG